MSVTEANRDKSENNEVEIRLSSIVNFLKNSRRVTLASSLFFLVVGVIYAFSKPNLYSAHVTVMPEIQSKSGGLGGLGGLAGLAGIDMGSMSGGGMEAIRPDIYPDILQSVPFALQILSKPVYSQTFSKESSLQDFIYQQSKQSWISYLLNENNGETVTVPDPENRSKTLRITENQEDLIKKIRNSVSAAFDKKTSMITVTATLEDPVVAATVARLSLEYLTNYITSYRTEKARSQVIFLNSKVEEAKNRYQRAEYLLSNYRDQNRSLFLNTAKIEEQRLQGDFILAQNVFNDLSKQLEQAKIKVSEESPVFKVLEPAQVPLRKSAPKRSLIIVTFTLIGAILGIVICGIRLFIYS